MRLSTLIAGGMAAILLCFVAVGGRVILREAGDYSRASAGVAAARLAQLTLTASTLVSFERGPTNAALGAESPVPAERRRPLEAARAATDQALDAITLRLAASDAREAAAITGPIISARRRLAAARQVIDGLLERPLESRTDRELNGVIAEMIAVIQELSPALNTMEATLARADSSLTSLITAARLATDMRDYAGQLGSVFTAPLVAKRPMTAADTTKLDRIMGYLDALNEQFQLTYSKLDHDPAMDTALADVHTRFFGAGRTLVLQTAEIGRKSGSYGLSTAAFAAQYVPEMRPLVALRDAAVARFTRGIDLVLASTALSMKFHGFAVALALCVVGATYRVMHVRVSMPLIALTRVIDRLARRDFDIEIPAMTRGDEIGRMAIAIEALRSGAIAAQANEAQIAHLARHDALTGLPNRALLQERMGHAFRMSVHGEKFAALCLDLDRFKAVNDTFGHPVGDILLRNVSERLLACVRDVDTVSRLGGDEFVILLVALDSPDFAGETAQRIIKALDEPFDLNGQRVFVGASVGIAIAPDDATSPVGLLRSADTALYRAKLDDRGSCRYFEPEMDQRLQVRVTLERDLREAVRNEAFDLFYQPQFDLAGDRLCGYEALLRWRHPVRGLVRPAEFIPLAEETGLISAIGGWVLRQACADAIKWPNAVKVAVNLSAVQFRNNALLHTVRQALRDSGLPAARLDLEITESVLLDNSPATLGMLHELKDLGLSITMDDFGTGYSSLRYLRIFPFDAIKIDQSFVRDLSRHEDSRAIIRAVVALAKALRMRTLAEGVETEEQLKELRRAGCDEVQGYLYGKPISVVPDGKRISVVPAGCIGSEAGARVIEVN